MDDKEAKLNLIWQRAKDGNGIDPETCACIEIDEKLEQKMSFQTVTTYSDFNNGDTSISYSRRRDSEAAQWEEWTE